MVKAVSADEGPSPPAALPVEILGSPGGASEKEPFWGVWQTEEEAPTSECCDLAGDGMRVVRHL